MVDCEYSVRNSHDDKENLDDNVIEWDFKTQWKEACNRTSHSQHGSHNIPRYIYHIARKNDWFLHANTYCPPGSGGVIRCCDDDRLDALVSKNYFHKEYIDCGEQMDTFVGKTIRFVKHLKEEIERRTICINALSCFSAPRRPIHEIRRPRSAYKAGPSKGIAERDDLLLIVIETTNIREDHSLRWDGQYGYPYIERALYKNGDTCMDFRLAYDTGYATVCVPSPQEIKARERILLSSNCMALAHEELHRSAY